MPSAAKLAPDSAHVLSVSQLSQQLKAAIDERFAAVWVAGEISNFSRPQSGHCYFTLKDEDAQLRAVMWRGTASRLKLDLTDGLEVVCFGRIDVYPPRGSYQLVVEELQPKGLGALELALRQLREKLAREGLFDPARKRPLPRFPRRIGVVTSPTGAAIRDFLEVLGRRWRGVETLVFPARVQGEGAAAEIVAAIRSANRVSRPLDALVVARGGGSLEDLWCFNDESVVRAIAASKIPTVSAIGHEIDVTLADLVADLRALTPSEAAERVVPSAAEVADSVDALDRRMRLAATTLAERLRSRLDALATRPALAQPLESIRLRERLLDEWSLRLSGLSKNLLRDRQAALAASAAKLETLSPLGVLGRGYSLTFDDATGRVVASVGRLRRGQRLRTQLADGAATSVVEAVVGRE
jgi:exodeoxyribonuclease VII large subunit